MLSHGTSSGATCSLHHQHHDHTSTPPHPWPSIMPYLVVVIHPRHSRGIGAPAGPTPIFTHITPFASAHAGMTATAQVMFWGCCSRKHVRSEWPGWLLAPAGRPAGPAGPLCQPLHTRFDRFSDWRLAKAFAGVATPDLVFRLFFALLVTVPSYRPKGVIMKAKNGVMGGHHTHMRTPSPTTHRRDPLLCSKIRQRYQRCGICVSLTMRIGSSAPCSCGSIWVCGGSDHFPRSCGSYRCTSTAAALRQWWE